MPGAVRLCCVNRFSRWILAIVVACVPFSNSFGGEAATLSAPLSPSAKAWLDEYGGTWGRVTPPFGDDKYYFHWNAWLTFAADAQGQLQIKGELRDWNAKRVLGTCPVSPPASFAFGATQWTWLSGKETCALQIKKVGNELSVDFSGCPKSCTTVTGFSDLRFQRLSTQPMQTPTGSSLIGLCVSDNTVVRQLCLSSKLRTSTTEYTALRKQADGVLAEKETPAEENQLLLQLARDCKDIACVEDALARVNRDLRQRIDQTASKVTSAVKFLPLPATLYRGTFGDTEATACLAVNDKGGLEGAYYDEKWGKLIGLSRAEPSTREPSPRVLEETDMSGYRKSDGAEWNWGVWRFDELNADEIRGGRRDLGSGKEIAFHMKKATTVATDKTSHAGCSGALEASRRLAVRIIDRQRVGDLEFVTYGNQWTDDQAKDPDDSDGIIGLRIERGLDEAVRNKINKALKESVDNANSAWFTCREMSFSQSALLLTETYLTVSESGSNYCGGPHTYYDSGVSVFNLRTGESANVDKWIDQAALAKSMKKGAIRQAIDSKGMEDQCLDVGGDFWLSKEGVVFSVKTSSPAFLMCNDDYTIPFVTFRKVISTEAKPLYDRYVKELKTAKAIK
ncbi:MAG: hypothetical protein FWC42_10620 [Proteobacteria bacterium]|nr:hypothetical protein [Pseudomonadota bacterium]